MRIGQGYDIHRLKVGQEKPLKLGGIIVDEYKSVVANSDGDALLHAIIDAIFGAAGLGDIGVHFPEEDDKFKNADSMELLNKTVAMLEPHNLKVHNVDATIILEKPKLGRKTRQMGANIAKALGLMPHLVNVKSKTREGLGAVGEGNAVECYAVAILEEPEQTLPAAAVAAKARTAHVKNRTFVFGEGAHEESASQPAHRPASPPLSAGTSAAPPATDVKARPQPSGVSRPATDTTPPVGQAPLEKPASHPSPAPKPHSLLKQLQSLPRRETPPDVNPQAQEPIEKKDAPSKDDNPEEEVSDVERRRRTIMEKLRKARHKQGLQDDDGGQD